VVFPLLGLKLNLDKTFVHYPFRESCGADYYRGVDVRPFTFGGGQQNLNRRNYLAFLYKTYNGLCRRWDPMEIRTTLRYILTEVVRVSDVVHRVPPEFPDTAGVKTFSPTEIPLDEFTLPFSPIKFAARKGPFKGFTEGEGNGVYVFSSLVELTKDRHVVVVQPYYWLALQGDPLEPGKDASPYSEARRQALRWLKTVRHRKVRVGKRLVSIRQIKYLPSTSARLKSPEYVARTGSTSEWT
jgi:hypothetical protein